MREVDKLDLCVSDKVMKALYWHATATPKINFFHLFMSKIWQIAPLCRLFHNIHSLKFVFSFGLHYL